MKFPVFPWFLCLAVAMFAGSHVTLAKLTAAEQETTDASVSEPIANNEDSTDDETFRDETRILHGASLYAKVQVIGMIYSKGQTQAMNQLRREKMMSVIAERMDDVTVKFHATVRDVTWRDGVASITTEPEFTPPKAFTGRRVLTSKSTVRMLRNRPIEVLMDQQAAAAMTPASLILFEAKLDFVPAISSTPRPRGVQEVYEVQHTDLGGQIGTFVSNDYKCTIGGQAYLGRYAKDSSP